MFVISYFLVIFLRYWSEIEVGGQLTQVCMSLLVEAKVTGMQVIWHALLCSFEA